MATGMNGEQAKDRCVQIREGAGQAIEWIRDVRTNAQGVDREADALIGRLRQARNRCRRLGAAAQRPLSIGVFGASQAGKSYLISTLASNNEGRLFTELEGHRLNFIGHINPIGESKEATGLVTRFTRAVRPTPAGFPIELELFTESDVLKILGTSFQQNFDREKVQINTDPEYIRQHLGRHEARRQPQPTEGLDEDDLVDVQDYFERRYPASNTALKGDFWPTVIDLAPRLPAAARGTLLSVLWGEVDELTKLYVDLCTALATLGHTRTVQAPLEALVQTTDDGFDRHPESIINVDALNGLGSAAASTISVLPASGQAAGNPVSIPRPLLSALTAELRLTLADAPQAGVLDYVDLLDFPGYRGPFNVASVSEVPNAVGALLLRGKVTYLFERYTEDQEMNYLLMCTPAKDQSDLATLAPALTAWVHSTQGESAEKRDGRPPGLLWVMTKFDQRLEPSTEERTERARRDNWSNMVWVTMKERFVKENWFMNWKPNQPFGNVFLVRKPGMATGVIDTNATKQETGVNEKHQERLQQERESFLAADRVKQHIGSAPEAWDAMMTLNDGGANRLAEYLGQHAVPEAKLQRISEQVRSLAEEITERRLGPYYFAEGAGEVEKKAEIAAYVHHAVCESAEAFGELLYQMQPLSEHLRQLYLRADAVADDDGAKAAPEAEAAPEPVRRRRSGVLSMSSSAQTGSSDGKTAKTAENNRAARFAKVVMRAWIKQLRDLPDDAERLAYLGLNRSELEAVVGELVTGSDRMELEGQLTEVLQPMEDRRAALRSRIVEQQVLLARCTVNDYVDTLGLEAVPLANRPASPVDGRERLFAPPASIAPGALPSLPDDGASYTTDYIKEWLEAFRLLAVDNAGHLAGREISPEQNQRLGEVLGIIAGTTATADT